MSRRSNIKWRKQDKKAISNTVRQFNAKITRVLKKNPDMQFILPERLTAKNIIDKIQTRQDFNRELSKYKRFLRKGAEKPYINKEGLVRTQWEKKEFTIMLQTVNRNRAIERKKSDFEAGSGRTMLAQDIGVNKLNLSTQTATPDRWKRQFQKLEKEILSSYRSSKYESYKANYIKALENVLGEHASEISNTIGSISAEEFASLYYSDTFLQIDYIYDPQEISHKAEQIKSHLKQRGY